MVTLSDIARRSRNETVALRKNLTAMLASVEAHARAIKEFGLTPGAAVRLHAVDDGDHRGAAACRVRRADVEGNAAELGPVLRWRAPVQSYCLLPAGGEERIVCAPLPVRVVSAGGA